MKFDYCVCNPPYQKEVAKIKTANQQGTTISLFHHFQYEAENIANHTCLIYPARWILQSGKGMQTFGKWQINDPHLEKLIVYPNPFDVFNGARIGDGISIVLKNLLTNSDNFEYIYIRR